MRNSLFFDFDRETKIALCKELKFPSEIAIAFVDADDYEMARVFLDRKDLLGDDLHKFVTSKSEDVRAKVAQNKEIDVDDLKILLKDVSDTVVIEALKNSNITADILDECVNNSDFIYFHDKSVILSLALSKTIRISQIYSLVELDKANYQIFKKDKEMILKLIFNVIENDNLSDCDVNTLIPDIFDDYFDEDVDTDTVIQIIEKMIKVRPDNNDFITSFLPDYSFRVLMNLGLDSYNQCSRTLYNMAFSELKKWYEGIGSSAFSIDDLFESIENLVCSKHLDYDKLKFIIKIMDKHLIIRHGFNYIPENMYVNILENLTSNSYLTEDSTRLIYKKIRMYSNVLSFDVNEMMINMCKNNPNTPYEIKELYMEI